MSDSKQVSRLQIDQITFGISSLNQEKRDLVRQHLYALHDRDGGILYKEGLHREMAQLFDSNQISEIEFNAIQHAFFG